MDITSNRNVRLHNDLVTGTLVVGLSKSSLPPCSDLDKGELGGTTAACEISTFTHVFRYHTVSTERYQSLVLNQQTSAPRLRLPLLHPYLRGESGLNGLTISPPVPVSLTTTPLSWWPQKTGCVYSGLF